MPVGTVETGGQISHLQLEHVWVEAAIDYFPSRGAINKAADAWVAMDPSYKQYAFLEGLDPIAISGIDAEQLANDFVAIGTVNETEGWVSGFDPSGLEAAQTQAQIALEDHITSSVVLDGELVVALISSFVPAAGDSFVLMTSSTQTISGTFDGVDLPTPPIGSGWDLAVTNSEVRLTQVDLAEVEATLLGDGNNTEQRSSVTQIDVQFDREVDADSDAFVLTRQGEGGGIIETSFILTHGSGKTTAAITFSGDHTRGGQSALVDGNYLLTIDPVKVRSAGTSVSLDGDGDGLQGGAYQIGSQAADGVFARFGDSDGDGDVDGPDYGRLGRILFRTAGHPDYNPIFDYLGDGDGPDCRTLDTWNPGGSAVMTEWEYHPPLDIDETLSEHLRNFPRQPYMLMYAIRSLAALLLRGWMRVYHRMRVDGRENLPKTGSFIMVCNHTSHPDTLSLLRSVPLRQIHRTFPAAAADYFFSSLPRSAVSAILINALPFDRQVNGAEGLTVCSELLANEGNILIIFPEGTRTTDGEMGRFRSDIGRLVVGTDLAVVPCYLDGGTRAWPKGKVLLRPFKLHLRIGPPQRFDHLEKSTESLQAICETLQESVASLGRTDK